MRERRIVELLFADAAERLTLRRLRPIAVWNLPDGWMFTAWCELRQDFRTFRLDRIARLAMTPDRFAPDNAKSLKAFIAKEGCGQQGPPQRLLRREMGS